MGSTTVTYALDAFGRTTSRVQGATTTAFVYAGSTEELVRLDKTGGTTSTTTFSSTPGGPLAQRTDAGTPQVYLRDLHGDIVGQIGTGASLAATSWFDPYGERTDLTGTAPTLGYQGQLTDATTGTVDMLTRQYVPELGRFATRDVFLGGPNDLRA